MSSARIQEAERLVEQLKFELDSKRIPVSQSCEELVDFCISQAESDYFIHKPPPRTPNPWKPENKLCAIV